MSHEWVYFDPNMDVVFKITVFDDGNDKYKEYYNEWHIIGEWRGKVSLMNAFNSKVQIKSISRWKIILCE